MTDLVFVDTNTVVYTRDQRDPWKAKRAAQWLARLDEARSLVVSPQVLNEAYSVGVRKFPGAGRDAVAEWVSAFVPFCTAPMDGKVFGTALAVEREFRFSWWDSLILASAMRAGCAYLLSEDMQHRQTVGSLRVIDPFREEPSALFPNR
jgi:predicted nucleic acid-binding protein